MQRLQVHDRLIGIGSSLVGTERSNHLRQRQSWNADAHRRKAAALHRNRSLHPYARQQQRLPPLSRRLRFVNARLRHQHSKIGLQPAMNRIFQRQPVRRSRGTLRKCWCGKQQ